MTRLHRAGLALACAWACAWGCTWAAMPAAQAQEVHRRHHRRHHQADEAAAHPGSHPVAHPSAHVARHYGGLDEDAILDALRHGTVLSAEAVGHTSVNFHVRFGGALDGGFKPSEARHVEHWRAEIAAFHVNRLLGLERVPPAVFRRVPVAVLPGAREAGVAVDAQGNAWGALIYWVPELRSIGINDPAFIARWTAWLQVGEDIPAESAARAEEVSTLLVFDYLIGNWDRWRGTNTLVDGAGKLVYRDNNGAFYEPFDVRRHEIALEWLRHTQRFSRAVIEQARLMTFESVRDALAADGTPTQPLLSDAQIRGLLTRRDSLVGYVDALVAQYGEAVVYPFP